jgi:uncharacterized protein YprB with RNaseH-like and TPR domain
MYPVVIDIETCGLKPETDRITCIGLKSAEEELVLTHPDEKLLLQKFLNWLAETESILKSYGLELTITGYNIKFFDLPFLQERCRQHGLFMSNGFKTLDLFIPYEKFDTVAARHGIFRECPLRGSDMPALWEQGRVDEIVRHCQDDVRATWQLFQVLQQARRDGR